MVNQPLVDRKVTVKSSRASDPGERLMVPGEELEQGEKHVTVEVYQSVGSKGTIMGFIAQRKLV